MLGKHKWILLKIDLTLMLLYNAVHCCLKWGKTSVKRWFSSDHEFGNLWIILHLTVFRSRKKRKTSGKLYHEFLCHWRHGSYVVYYRHLFLLSSGYPSNTNKERFIIFQLYDIGEVDLLDISVQIPGQISETQRNMKRNISLPTSLQPISAKNSESK